MSEIERESMEVDILYVGAGPATLASALHLMASIEAHNEKVEQSGGEPIEPPTILVIEKAAGIGDHQLSGAVINPRAIAELMPDFVEQAPIRAIAENRSLSGIVPTPASEKPSVLTDTGTSMPPTSIVSRNVPRSRYETSTPK